MTDLGYKMSDGADFKTTILSQANRIAEVGRSYEVLGTIHPNDFLFRFLLQAIDQTDPGQAIAAYFEDGADSCRRFAQICAEQGMTGAFSVLEFASGYGRVARHEHRFLPQASWTCSDIHEEAIAYLQNEAGLEAIQSSVSPEAFDTFGRCFDVVFCLSFFSHIPDASFGRWLRRLLDCVTPGGLLVFTTHGEISARTMRTNGMAADLGSDGYFWDSSSDQGDLTSADYGTSAVSFKYVHNLIQTMTKAGLVRYEQGWWWRHQDLYVIRRSS